MSIVIDLYNQVVNMQGFAPYIVGGVIVLYLLSRNKSRFKIFLTKIPGVNIFKKRVMVLTINQNGYFTTDFKEVTKDKRLKFSGIVTENSLKNPKIMGNPLYDEASKKHVYIMEKGALETIDWASKIKSNNELDDTTAMSLYVAGQQVAAHNLKPFSIDKKTLYIVIILIFAAVANVAIGWLILQNIDKLATLQGLVL